MAIVFEDLDTERFVIAACLKGADYWQNIPSDYFYSDISKKTYKELQSYLGDPYRAYPTVDLVFDKSKDVDVKLFVKEVSTINVERSIVNTKVYDLFQMWGARKVYDIASTVPNDLEKNRIEEVVRAKIRDLAEVVNPFEVGQRKRGFIYDSASARWERYRSIERDPSLLKRIPYGIQKLDMYTNGGTKRGRITLFYAKSGGFKCLEENSILTDTVTGRQFTIKEVVDNKLPIHMLGLDAALLKSKDVSPSDFVDSGIQDVYEVKLKSGKSITGPLHHPLYTDKLKWLTIGELNKDLHRVAVPRYVPFPEGGGNKEDTYKVKLLAYMLAEGNLDNMLFTNTDKMIRRDFKNCVHYFGDVTYDADDITIGITASSFKYSCIKTALRNLIVESKKFNSDRSFCKHVGIHTSLWCTIKNGKRGFHRDFLEKIAAKLNVEYIKLDPKLEVPFKCSNSRNWFKTINVKVTKSITKELPQWVFELDKQSLSVFLGVYLLCDGTIGHDCVVYSTSSKKLAEQLQHLLLRFGIMARLKEYAASYTINDINGIRTTKRGFTSYQVKLYGNDVIEFFDNIGDNLFGYKKNKLSKLYAKLKCTDRNNNVDTISVSAIISCVGINEFNRVMQKCRHRLIRDKNKLHGLSRESLKGMIWVFEESYRDKLAELCDSDILWDDIASISFIGKRHTYDLSIDKYHSFTANDIFVHNTKVLANIAYNMAYAGRKIMIVTLEQSKDEYEDIIDSRDALVDLAKLANAELDDEDRERHRQALSEMVTVKPSLYLVDIPGDATTADLITENELYYINFGEYPEVTILDYINEINSVTPWGGSNTGVKYKNVGVEIRHFARTYNQAVISAMQENKKARDEKKDKKKVDLEHIGESFSFANVCYLVINLFQDEEGNDAVGNVLNWGIKKNRGGQNHVTFSTFINPAINYVGDRQLLLA